MWELDHKECWVPKNWCFWTVVLEKTLEIQPVSPKGNQSWILIGRSDVEAETLILWPSDGKNWLIEKTLILGKIEGRRRRGWQRMRCLDGISDGLDMSLSRLQDLVVQQALHAAVHGVTNSWIQLSNWSALNFSSAFLTTVIYWNVLGSLHENY